MLSYAPPTPTTTGFAVTTDRFLGIVSADAAPDLIASLHRTLDEPDATIDAGLALLSQPDVAQRFALAEMVDLDERIVLVAVRGEVVVDLDGTASSRFTWPQGAAWVTGEARGVSSLRLSLAPVEQVAAQWPLGNGVVAAQSVSVEWIPSAPADLPAFLTGTDAPPASPTQVEPPAPEPDRRERRLDLAQLMDKKTWTLRLPDGNELEAAPQIVVGRRPWRSSPDETSTYYVVVPSPDRQVSGKHVEFAVVGDELLARDLDSTNGTLVMSAQRAPRLLHHGGATRLDDGDTLDLGEGFQIVVGSRP